MKLNSAPSPTLPGWLPRLALVLLIPASASSLIAQTAQHYKQTNLVSNQASLAPNRDANLVNAWGLTRSSKSPWWVSDNGTGRSTLYDGTGTAQSLVVTIPPADTSSTTGTPTGTIFNGDPNAFQIAPGKSAAFLFVTEDGTISGWNPGVQATSAVIMVNNKDKSVYKGATIATATVGGVSQSLLYVADFRRGNIAVFDATFKPVTLNPDSDEDRDHRGPAFEDERIPNGYAPFNVQNIGGNLYVAFAKQDAAKHDEVDGAGIGFVDAFSPRGRLLLRLQHGSWFNAPWGLTLASSDFGAYSHDVLVGQFGSGQILAFDPITGKFKGALNDANNNPIAIDGLWAIAFGNDATAGPATTLFFTSGPDHEQNGLFGSLTAIENVQGGHQ
jgi:uncharacterized protein (TIGR03118 family)